MSDPERWARTDDQIERMQAARHQGGLCAWCGREIADGETVYVERFLVGTRRDRPHGPVRHRAITYAPVGRECASPELLRETEGQDPERCASCGRGVFYRQSQPLRQRATCSRRCVSRFGLARRAPRPTMES